MRPKKKGDKIMQQKVLSLKISADLHRKWKVQAAVEETTMSEIAEKLISEYLKKKGVVK
jgi:vacuolar-type H+-ATPase subunit B/Vma2